MWEIKLKVDFPNESFRRGGVVFTKGKPVILKELSEAIQKEISLPGTPLEAVKIEDKITTLKRQIDQYEEKLPDADKETYLSPLRAIRKYCVRCGGSQKAPRNCKEKTCPLFVFRLGKNPRRVGIGPGKIKKISGS